MCPCQCMLKFAEIKWKLCIWWFGSKKKKKKIRCWNSSSSDCMKDEYRCNLGQTYTRESSTSLFFSSWRTNMKKLKLDVLALRAMHSTNIIIYVIWSFDKQHNCVNLWACVKCDDNKIKERKKNNATTNIHGTEVCVRSEWSSSLVSSHSNQFRLLLSI